MKYVPKDTNNRDNVNVTRTSPLRDLFTLLAGTTILLFLLFFIVGLFVDLTVKHIPPKFEKALGTHLETSLKLKKNTMLEHLLENITVNIPSDSPMANRTFRIAVMKNEQVNAIAIPGDLIVIFSGLLDEVKSENELSMIIGHELGHFANRDHLTRLGRGLVLAILTNIIISEASASKVTSFFTDTIVAQYSQSQESAADEYGLTLLVKQYGHAAGATDFFERITKKTKNSKLAHLFASHPHPEQRVNAIQDLIKKNHYYILTKKPLTK